MKRDRDKKGRFLPSNPPSKFALKYVKRSEIVTDSVSNDAIDAAFKAGFEVARRTPKTHGVKVALEAYRQHGNNATNG